jgi:hypothetical protein
MSGIGQELYINIGEEDYTPPLRRVKSKKKKSRSDKQKIERAIELSLDESSFSNTIGGPKSVRPRPRRNPSTLVIKFQKHDSTILGSVP